MTMDRRQGFVVFEGGWVAGEPVLSANLSLWGGGRSAGTGSCWFFGFCHFPFEEKGDWLSLLSGK